MTLPEHSHRQTVYDIPPTNRPHASTLSELHNITQ